MTKKQYLAIFGIFIFLLLGMDFFIKFVTESPAFLDTKVVELQNDSLLMNNIGGYRSFQFSYDKSTPEIDTIGFKITIFGRTANLVNKGRAIKDSEKSWKVIEDEIYVQE